MPRSRLIIAGHGVQMGQATEELRQLVEQAEIPVTTTLLGLGDLPETHPLALGMCGMHGEAHTNLAIQECDVLIGVGMRFDDRVTGKLDEFAPKAKIIHLEMDPAEVGKNVKPDVALIGDCKDSLQALLARVQPARHLRMAGGNQGLARGRRRTWISSGRSGRADPALCHAPAVAQHQGRDASSSPMWASIRCGKRSTSSTSARGS